MSHALAVKGDLCIVPCRHRQHARQLSEAAQQAARREGVLLRHAQAGIR